MSISNTDKECFGRAHAPNAAGCWIWKLYISPDGYGLFSITNPKKYTRRAHRLSYELAHGPIPQGLHVLHKCDVPACVNPDHLFLGTHTDNMRDKKRKDRQHDQRGERNPGSVLTAETVRQIRAELAAGLIRKNAIAKKYGTTPQNINNIRTGRSWSHVA